jgi:hypothetical protein
MEEQQFERDSARNVVDSRLAHARGGAPGDGCGAGVLMVRPAVIAALWALTLEELCLPDP